MSEPNHRRTWFTLLVIVPLATLAGLGWAWLAMSGARAILVGAVGAASGFAFFGLLKLRDRIAD
jgi:hypothetical protein